MVPSRTLPLGLTSALLVLLFAATSHAEELSVPSERYPSLQKALRAARSGDTVRLAPGTYTLRRLSVRRSGVTLDGAGATIELRGRRPRVKLRGRDTAIRGVRFESTAVRVRGAGATLEGCSFAGSFRTNAVELAADRARVTACTFQDVTLQPNADALVAVTRPECRVDTSTLHVNGTPSRDFHFGVLVRGELAIVEDNTFSARVGANDRGVLVEADRTWVRNNVLTGLTGDAISLRGNAALVENNDVRDHRGDSALQLAGDVVRAVGNTIACTGRPAGHVVLLRGDAPELTDTVVTGLDGLGAIVIGQDAVVRDNQIEGAGQGLLVGLSVRGDRAEVSGNRVTVLRPKGEGIRLAGDAHVAAGNSVTNPITHTEGAAGLVVTGDDATLQDNTTSDVRDGLRLLGARATVTRHLAEHLGQHGVDVNGNGHRILDSVVRDSAGSGFHVASGTGHALIRCTSEAGETGIAILVEASASRIEGCSSLDALRHGLLNDGPDSAILDSTFLRSLLADVAGAAVPATQSGNTFETGGFATD